LVKTLSRHAIFGSFFRDYKAGTDAQMMASAQRHFGDLQKLVGAVQIAAPDGAEILVDGTPLEDKAPLPDPTDMTPGAHVLGARLGDKKSSVDVTVKAGEKTSARIPDFALPIEVPDIERGKTLPPKTPPPIVPPPTHSSARTWTLVGTGVAAGVAAGLGVLFAVRAGNASSEAERFRSENRLDTCTRNPNATVCADASRIADERTTNINLARGAFVTAGVAGLGFVAAWFLWPATSSPSQSGRWIAPSVGARDIGVHLGGRF
jgi:hypothetical protein